MASTHFTSHSHRDSVPSSTRPITRTGRIHPGSGRDATAAGTGVIGLVPGGAVPAGGMPAVISAGGSTPIGTDPVGGPLLGGSDRPTPTAPAISSGRPAASRTKPVTRMPIPIGASRSLRNPACTAAETPAVPFAFMTTTAQFPGWIVQRNCWVPGPDADLTQNVSRVGSVGAALPGTSRYAALKGRYRTFVTWVCGTFAR